MYLTEEITVSNIVYLNTAKLLADIYRSLWQTMAEDTFPIIRHGIFIEVSHMQLRLFKTTNIMFSGGVPF